MHHASVWHVFLRDLTVLPAHAHVHPQSEWAASAFPAVAGTHLPTPGDGRLSEPWCEVTPAEIRTCNLFPIANPALYHMANSAREGFIACIELGWNCVMVKYWGEGGSQHPSQPAMVWGNAVSASNGVCIREGVGFGERQPAPSPPARGSGGAL